jgi:hypothetical protein
MKQVVLAKLPNSIQFLGTFDTTNYEKWWKSEPLPDGATSIPAEITQNEWCYGQYHMAAVRMADGTYSLYRSTDYGKTWSEAKNFPGQIYTLTRIDYGWMLLNTPAGWYQSTNTGRTWTLISTGAPGCKTVVNIGENILIGHSGEKIYRSEDTGVTWSQVQDCHLLSVMPWHATYHYTIYNTADCYPALAGVNNRVLAGAGPYLIASDDGGQNWTIFYSPFNNFGWFCDDELDYYTQQQSRCLQLIWTGGTSATPEDNTFMARMYNPITGVVRHYYSGNIADWFSAITHPTWTDRNLYGGGLRWASRFDQPFSGYYNGKMTAYETMVQNTSTTQSLVYSSQMEYNPTTGGNSTSPKFSDDGGLTWEDLDPNLFKVYIGDPDTSTDYTYGGAFVSENYTKTVWVGFPCHNEGHYLSTGYIQRGISLDMDMLSYTTRTKSWSIDTIIKAIKQGTYDMDALVMLCLDKSYAPDALIKRIGNKGYSSWTTVMRKPDFGQAFDAVIVQRRTRGFSSDVWLKDTFRYGVSNDVLVRGPVENTYDMNLILVTSHVDEWGVKMEREMPQYPLQEWPQLQYEVKDSRKGDV